MEGCQVGRVHISPGSLVTELSGSHLRHLTGQPGSDKPLTMPPSLSGLDFTGSMPCWNAFPGSRPPFPHPPLVSGLRPRPRLFTPRPSCHALLFSDLPQASGPSLTGPARQATPQLGHALPRLVCNPPHPAASLPRAPAAAASGPRPGGSSSPRPRAARPFQAGRRGAPWRPGPGRRRERHPGAAQTHHGNATGQERRKSR